jgi:hypothetical protein
MSIFAVTHLHEYGSTAYLVSSETAPTVKQLVRDLALNFEPSKSESLEVCALSDEEYRNPKQLTWRRGDDEEFDEFAVEDDGDAEASSGDPDIR